MANNSDVQVGMWFLYLITLIFVVVFKVDNASDAGKAFVGFLAGFLFLLYVHAKLGDFKW